MITLFWVGKQGVFWGGGSFYPSNTLDRAPSIQSIYLGLMCTHGLNESQQGLKEAFYGAALAAIVLKWLQEGLNQTLACRAEFAFWG